MTRKRQGIDGWEACTWAGARDDALQRGRAMSFREKLIWLENADRLSRAFRVHPPDDRS
jgi:hypothetical protein